MIERITGTLEAIHGSEAVLNTDGPFDCRVLLPAYLAARLAPQTGVPVTLHTHFYLEAQGQGTSFVPRLIGFGSPMERSFFEVFTTVKGVGARKAIRAMAAEPADISRAIVGRDTKALVALPEIGKRLAETIIAELDGKVARFLSTDELDTAVGSAQASQPAAKEGPEAEAVAALVALGEALEVAERMVVAAAGTIEPKPATTAALIQAAYRAGR